MKLIGSISKKVNNFFSDANQIQRIVIYLGIALALASFSFGGYYYYDRYYTGQPKPAEENLKEVEQAVRDNPQDPQARLALAEAYMLNFRFEDAITQAQKVKELFPETISTEYIMGISYANSGKCQEALEPLTVYVDALKDQDMPGLDRRLQAASYYLGDCYLQLNRPQDAVAPLENAVNWSRTDADSMFKLGLAYAGVNEHEKAVNMFHAATTFVPDYFEAYTAMVSSYEALQSPARAQYAKGMASYAQKDYDAALQILLEASQAAPDFAPTFAGLGMTYEALNELPNAKTSYEAALQIDANNFAASNGVQRVSALINK